ncbi:MAG: alpha-2-macroglobulin family protein [Acidobacteriota bacterium]
MKKIITFALLCAASFISVHAQRNDYQSIKSEAERYYSEGSYARAHELYLRADTLKLDPSDARWVDFRVADTLWRAQAATQTADSSKFDQARSQLESLVRDVKREEDRDLAWVEAMESLGDFWWMRTNSKNWHLGWQYYQASLDWWAGSADLDAARERYLKIIRKISRPAWAEQYYYYGYYGNFAPLEVLENALRIARTENDRAHLHYLLAMTIRGHGGYYEDRRRVVEEFEAAISAGKETDWYDDALYYYAEWMMSYGRFTQLQNGQWQNEPDYRKALELFRRLISEHAKGETRYYDQARGQIENITRPSINVGVSNIFLPDSEIEFYLGWRNVKRVDLALYRVDLASDIRLIDKDDSAGNWIERINLASGERVKFWTKETADSGDHRPGQEKIRVENRLPLGAYVVEGRSGNLSTRDLILVTDRSLVLKTGKRQSLAYFCNAIDGSPVAGATVKVWEHFYAASNWHWREQTAVTNRDGIAQFTLTSSASNTEVFAVAALEDRQAFAQSRSYYGGAEQPWKIYAFTDRAAYRPNETAQWKFIARRYQAGVYSTPVDQTVEYEITDAKGAKVKEGKAGLNQFGSAWGSLELTDKMSLGEYRINFWDEGRKNHIGNAALFRLEEYKLPEFKVAVRTPEEEGRKKTFRVGEKVEVEAQADYYFGGAVANATVEVVVYQNPFYQWWRPHRDYRWYYEDFSPARYNYGQGQIIKRETIKTDAFGKARLKFDTPRYSQQDFQYRIEARVTDSSRREVIGAGEVRVTRQRYYVYPHAAHYLYRPQDKVAIKVKALDANDQAVEAEGKVAVTRDYWYEIWTDPAGKEYRSEEIDRLRRAGRRVPTTGWKLKFRGYRHDEILAQIAKTDSKGEAEITFTAEREGYYRFQWTSADKDGATVRAETWVWVATGATSELGYRHGGLEIIVDRDTFHAGQKAAVMIAAPAAGRWVLFAAEGDDIYNYQLVRLDGTVKLIEFQVEDKHVPNIFLTAAMVNDRQIFMDVKQVIVPPVEHFLSVEVKADREEYEPREEGTLTVTTRDHAGRAVPAEVAIGLVDEAVSYIQTDYTGDPRQFYFGGKRAQTVQTQSTFQMKAYAKLVEGENKQLIDERNRQVGQKDSFRDEDAAISLRAQERGAESITMTGGVSGGYARGRSDLFIDGASEAKKEVAQSLPINGRRFNEPSLLKPGVAAPAEAAAGAEPAVVVRSDFRSTILWQPGLVTDRNGKATVKVKYPDSLTGWTATARVATATSQFGIASATTRTNQPLAVRLQAPRFFVAGDRVTVSAVINNNTAKAMMVSPSIVAEGVTVTGLVQNGEPVKGELGPVEVPANGEKRVDWFVVAGQTGHSKIKVAARADRHADAMEREFITHEHGVEKFIARSGKMRGQAVSVRLDIPRERKADSTALTVQIAPSLAVTMLDALPYLIDYPYGCTEQTMSRFLPAAITAKTLRDLGIKPEAVMGKIFGGIERGTAAATHPRGEKDLRKLDEMIEQGLKRLYDFQHSDGGWGWWKDGESDHFMTAYVVWGLTLARESGVEVKTDVIERGAQFLDKELVEEEESFDQQAWMLHALAVHHRAVRRSEVEKFQAKAFENLWTNRDRLNAYTRALAALAAHYYGRADRAMTLVENLENGVKIDSAPDASIIEGGGATGLALQTAHWGEDGIYWRWSDGGVEATSFALRALLAIDPRNRLVEPVTNWLIKNRRGAQWSNTRDTAITVLALNDYLKASGELQSEIEYELRVNDQLIVSKKLTAEDALSAPSRFAIEQKFLRDGVNVIRINRKGGASPIYFAAEAKFFSQEEPVTSAGNEIFTRRDYYRLVAKPTLLKGYVYEKLLLADNDSVVSGDRIEAVITIEAKNNYEYLLFEDLKPAGAEAVEIRSGQPLYARELKGAAVERRFGERIDSPAAGARLQSDKRRPVKEDESDYTGRARWVYQELRDRKVALFIDKLPEGVWEIRYELRAEAPGLFHALPVLGHAMYVPEIRCNGREMRVRVTDRE